MALRRLTEARREEPGRWGAPYQQLTNDKKHVSTAVLGIVAERFGLGSQLKNTYNDGLDNRSALFEAGKEAGAWVRGATQWRS